MHVQSNDEVIVNRCLEGDRAAFAFLVGKYKETVHAYAYHRVSDYQDAQDITQEVFVKAYRKLAQLKWPHRFQSWLYTIASNECSTWLREHLREREQEVHLEDIPARNLNELALRNHSDEDIDLTVRSAMETLPDDRQLILSLFYMSNLSIKEIAHFMGVSPNSIGIKLHRARKQLGERMEKMIGKRLSKEKLKAGFAFKVVDSIRDMPIPSLPKPRSIRWVPIPISIGMALLIGIIGYGVSSGRDITPDIPILKQETFAVSLLPDVDEQRAMDMNNSDESQPVALYSGDDRAEEAGRSSDKEIVVRKLRFNQGGSPSPDGRYLSFDNGDGDLTILDLTTGESRDIIDEGSWEGASSTAIHSTWSPDSKQIACWWSGGEHSGLRIVGLDGSKPRDLYVDHGPSEFSAYGCYDWSQDGKSILAILTSKTGKNAGRQEIALVSVADGSVRILKSLWPRPEGMSLSPDSRYVAYDRPVKEHEDSRDIFLLTTDGSGKETRLTEHPAKDYYPVWSPDGNSIIFTSNRAPGGTMGLWLTQVVDSRPAGVPQLVKKEAGNIGTLGFTEKGSLFYVTGTSWSDIYVTSVDMETGEILSTPELLASQGLNTMPTWSPDGESLAYVSERTAPGSFRSRPVLMIRSMKTGEERELILDQNIASDWGTLGQLQWSPDGRSILCGGRPSNNIHLVDVQTGHVTANVATGNEGVEVIWGPAWSPDGKTIFFTRMSYGKEDWPCRMVALDLETRKERELYPGGSRGSFLAVSPDGRQLAFSDKDREEISVIPTEGGEPSILLNRKDLNLRDTDRFYAPFAWTPDGRYVLFTLGKFSSDEQSDGMVQLWRISAEGGMLQKVLEMEREKCFHLYLCPLSLHPDGRRIAFQKGKHGKVDLWIMENLLSTASR